METVINDGELDHASRDSPTNGTPMINGSTRKSITSLSSSSLLLADDAETSQLFENSSNKFDLTTNSASSSDLSNLSNSDLNVTVIHITSSSSSASNSARSSIDIGSNIGIITNNSKETDANKDNYSSESKDSKDGSDSGVDGCTLDTHRVQSCNSLEYASSCTNLDEVSCDSSLASCCSVYEDAPCSAASIAIRSAVIGGSRGIIDSTIIDNDVGHGLIPDGKLTSTRNDHGNGLCCANEGSNSVSSSSGSGATNVVAAGAAIGAGEGTSEGGSESSSLAGSVSSKQKRTINAQGTAGAVKKKLTAHVSEKSSNNQQRVNLKMTQSTSCLVNGTCPNGARAKPRTSSVHRTNSLTRSSQTSATKDRGRSREKVTVRDKDIRDGSSSSSVKTAAIGRSCTASFRSKSRSDAVTSALTKEINKDLAQRGQGIVAKTNPRQGHSMTRISHGSSSSTNSSRLSCTTPSDESNGRASNSVGRSGSLQNSVGRTELRSTRNLDKMTASFDGVGRNTIETYGTLPRTARHKFAVPKQPVDKPSVTDRSRSASRDASLNRTLSKKTLGKDGSLPSKGLPPCPKQRVTPERIRIYHEVSVQTGLTGQDIVKCLAGVATVEPNPESAEKAEEGSQTESSWEEMKALKESLKTTTVENEAKKKENSRLQAEVDMLRKQLEEEKTDHAFVRQELDKNTQRVLAMLGTPQAEHTDGNDSFLELESQFQSSGKVVVDQKHEIASLQGLCKLLSRDLEKSLGAQKTLILQQQELEAESTEMQEFLQEEKAALEIALKESEQENKKKEENLKKISSELERQTEECKHLVRISEQRRQENLSLSMKLNALERRNRELLLAQGAAVSGASVALSGLGSRLEGLVGQLVMSYNISEKDLEDVIYHNEAFSRSNSSVDSSPASSKHSTKDCTPSPKRGSFVSAVIGAIRNAATHPFVSKQVIDKDSVELTKSVGKDPSSEVACEILDFETEPCIMMDNVLEDVPLTDTYSHNMVSSCDSFRRVLSVPEPIDEHNLRNTKLRGESSSLTNLTQAILHRRKVEDEEEEKGETGNELENCLTEGLSSLTDYCPATSLVDQVIDVDNLVTKLLKVLRIIQLENDTCIQELKDEKTELELRLEILLAERKVAEYSHDSEKENYSNGIIDRPSIFENYK